MKLSAIIIMCTMALTGHSQDSSASGTPTGKTCEEYKSLYYQYLRNEMYRDARYFWLLAYEKCGGTKKMNNTFFTNGTIIYDKLASETFKNDSIHQKEVLDSIHWIYEQYLIINPSADLKLKYVSVLLKEKSTDTIRM